MSTYVHSVGVASHSKYGRHVSGGLRRSSQSLDSFRPSHPWHWSPVFAGAAPTLVTQRLVAYLVPNEDSPGRVPGKTSS